MSWVKSGKVGNCVKVGGGGWSMVVGVTVHPQNTIQFISGYRGNQAAVKQFR